MSETDNAGGATAGALISVPAVGSGKLVGLGVPHDELEDDALGALFVAVVPHLVHEAVVEEEHAPLAPAPRLFLRPACQGRRSALPET